MVDIDEKGGIQVFLRDLLDAGLLNGNIDLHRDVFIRADTGSKSSKA